MFIGFTPESPDMGPGDGMETGVIVDVQGIIPGHEVMINYRAPYY
jgi:hypothetical protein